MASIKILDNIDITDDGLKMRNEQVFLHQGDIDGACGVYSLMMALIIEGAIKFKDMDLNAQEDKDQREAKQKLFKAFTSDLGLIEIMCAVGYEIGEEEEIVTKIFCLDPGSNKPINTYWNAIIKIDANLKARNKYRISI